MGAIWLNLFSLLLLIVALVWMVRSIRQSNRETVAVMGDCDWADTLMMWRLENQGTCIPCSNKGRAFVIKRMHAYQHLLMTCTYVSDVAHLAFLEELLTVHTCPGPPGKHHSPPTIKLRPLGLGFYQFPCAFEETKNRPEGLILFL